MSFYDVIQITLPKIRYLNDVINCFSFLSLSLSKTLVVLLVYMNTQSQTDVSIRPNI